MTVDNVTPISAGKPTIAQRLKRHLISRQSIARPIQPGELEAEMQALLDGPLADPELLAELVRNLGIEDSILFAHYRYKTRSDPMVELILREKAKRADQSES